MKAISFSIFGFDTGRQDGCFDYLSYLRSLSLNVRLARVLFPEWQVVVHIDQASYDAHKAYWDLMPVTVEVLPKEPLTKAMLWRLRPIFKLDEQGKHKYTHTICRDTDAPLTYRDRQAVQYWVDHGKVAHAITDSISHTIPMMGGMIGFTQDFCGRTGWGTWEQLLSNGNYEFSIKGADQDFLCGQVYPRMAQHGSDSITQHYFNGMPNTFLSDFHSCDCMPEAGHKENCPENYKVDLPDEMRETNGVGGHIGCAGWWERPMFDFLSKHKDKFLDIARAEQTAPDVFYWTKNNIF